MGFNNILYGKHLVSVESCVWLLGEGGGLSLIGISKTDFIHFILKLHTCTRLYYIVYTRSNIAAGRGGSEF